MVGGAPSQRGGVCTDRARMAHTCARLNPFRAVCTSAYLPDSVAVDGAGAITKPAGRLDRSDGMAGMLGPNADVPSAETQSDYRTPA